MTETMIDLPGVIAKSDDADFLRELIQDAAQQLTDIEVAAVCGAGHGDPFFAYLITIVHTGLFNSRAHGVGRKPAPMNRNTEGQAHNHMG